MKIATDQKQSERLIGRIGGSTADMYYPWVDETTPFGGGYHRPYPAVCETGHISIGKPCWSLTAILNLLPKQLILHMPDCSRELLGLSIEHKEHWIVAYYYINRDGTNGNLWGWELSDDLMDAAVEMLLHIREDMKLDKLTTY